MDIQNVLREPRGEFGRVESALRATIHTLDGQGMLKESDRGLLGYLVSTARAVDGPNAGAILRKEYREALQTLILRCERDSSVGGDILSGVFAAVGDAQTPGAVHLRATGGRDREVARDPVHAVAASGRRRRAGTAA